MTWDEYVAEVRAIIEEIEIDTRESHRANGTRPLGAAKVMARHPHSWPAHVERSPAPQYHCSSKEKRPSFWAAFKEFVAAYRDAAERLRAGELTVAFPMAACHHDDSSCHFNANQNLEHERRAAAKADSTTQFAIGSGGQNDVGVDVRPENPIQTAESHSRAAQ